MDKLHILRTIFSVTCANFSIDLNTVFKTSLSITNYYQKDLHLINTDSTSYEFMHSFFSFSM